jgi:hypothetical protein
MLAGRTHPDIFCLALYTLAGERGLRGFMLATISDRLGISFGQTERMAIAAAKAGLVKMEFGTITLTSEGQARGATLTAPTVKKSAGRHPPATRSAPRAKPRPGRRG